MSPIDPSTMSGDSIVQSTGERRTVLVTGGAKRVGRAICRAFASQGFDVVLTYRRSASEAVKAQLELQRFGVACAIHALDLNDTEQVVEFAQHMAMSLPRLDVLVHNASIYAQTPLTDLTANEALHHYRVNALAPLLLSQRLVGRLAESSIPGHGSIIAMLDIHAEGLPRRSYSAYAMSKAALSQLVRSLARDLAPHVRVNGVAPGVVAWPESGNEADKEVQKRYLKSVPMDRAGKAEEAAEAVLWLATRATYTTGQVIRVDGGRWLI